MKNWMNVIFRWIVKVGFPSKVRIFCLRSIGASVGKDVYIGDGFTLASVLGFEKNLVIEDRVSIGPNVTVILTSDPNNSALRNFKSIYKFIEVRGNVHIKHDSWIGAGVIIFPNVRIGEFSVVGAGSVVTKDVPPYSVVAGNPAKILYKLEDIKKLNERK